MSAVKLASRYAKSILGLAIEQGKLEEVYADMKYIDELTEQSKEFFLMLKSPLIHADKKLKIIKAVVSGKISELTMSFVEIAVKKHREGYLRDIALAFISQYYKHKNITAVKLTTAVELDQESIEDILNKLKEQTDFKTISLTTEIDKDLIGGFMLQFEDKLLDASVARKLELLSREMSESDYIIKY